MSHLQGVPRSCSTSLLRLNLALLITSRSRFIAERLNGKSWDRLARVDHRESGEIVQQTNKSTVSVLFQILESKTQSEIKNASDDTLARGTCCYFDPISHRTTAIQTTRDASLGRSRSSRGGRLSAPSRANLLSLSDSARLSLSDCSFQRSRNTIPARAI